MMEKVIGVLLSFFIAITSTACGTVQNEASQSVQDIKTEDRIEAVVSESEQGETVENKTLVVYFSCTKTTEQLAVYAAESLNADLYEIVPTQPYTDADLAYYTDGRADQEQNDPAARPAISGNVENMEDYQTIILGYPIWHGQAPRIISTFLESYDFSGKTIIPFCTSHSSGIGSSADNLHFLCSDKANWKDGKRFEDGTSKDMMQEWLNKVLEN